MEWELKVFAWSCHPSNHWNWRGTSLELCMFETGNLLPNGRKEKEPNFDHSWPAECHRHHPFLQKRRSVVLHVRGGLERWEQTINSAFSLLCHETLYLRLWIPCLARPRQNCIQSPTWLTRKWVILLQVLDRRKLWRHSPRSLRYCVIDWKSIITSRN